MANQPETPNFDAGIYQLETGDPVQGGAGGLSNVPILGLSNRTRWLKDQVDALLVAIGLKAPIASPTFTGDPKAPTPPAGDSDTSIATTAFVQQAISGVLTKSVAGSGTITLSDVEGGGFFYRFTGTLTGNRTVVFPQRARQAVVWNDTSGGFTLTVKMATGAGIVVQRGRLLHVVLDGTDAHRGTTDFHDAALTGDPTAPTPPFGDNDTSIATTAFVQSAIAAAAAWSTGDLKVTLKTVADPGWVMMDDGTIGNAGSGASTRANADCLALYVHIWNTIPDQWAPVLGGRGGSALDDWNANRRLTLPRALGRALAGAGAGAGLTARPLGSHTGAEAVQLTPGQMPRHKHLATALPAGEHGHSGTTGPQNDADNHSNKAIPLHTPGGDVDRGTSGAFSLFSLDNTDVLPPAGPHFHNFQTTVAPAHPHDVDVQDAGNDEAHPNMQPSLFVNFMVKL